MKEEGMKAYTAPTLVAIGTALTETLIGAPFVANESLLARQWSAGGVGYYL